MFKEMSFTAKVAVGIAATAAVAAAGYGVYSYCATESEKKLAKRLDDALNALTELQIKAQANAVQMSNFSFIMEITLTVAMVNAYKSLIAEGLAKLEEEQVANIEKRLAELIAAA